MFSTAVREFGAAAERFPESMFASNALYWQAKALEKTGNSPQALPLYEQVARDYPYTYYGIRAQEILRARPSSAHASGNAVLSTDGFAPPAGRSALSLASRTLLATTKSGQTSS
jgi:hypothetical protein